MTVTIQHPPIDVLAYTWKFGNHLRLGSHSFTSVLSDLKDAGLYDPAASEKMLIIGSRNLGKKFNEDHAATLIAVAPGLILCNFVINEFVINEGARYCTGLLGRTSHVRYDVDPFAKHNGEHIYGSARIECGPGPVDNREAAAVFYWSFGRDEGSCVGITPARWGEMKQWIDRWLDASK